MATSTRSNNSGAVTKPRMVMEMLHRFHVDSVFYKLGKESKHPKNSGNVVYWTKVDSFTGGGALSEGASGSNETIGTTTYSATPSRYGNYVQISEELATTSLEGWMQEVGTALSENMVDVLDDTVIRDGILAGNGTTQYTQSGFAARTDITDASASDLTVANLRKAEATLKANKIKEHPKFGCYVAVIHPHVAYDVKGDSEYRANVEGVPKGFERLVKGKLDKLHNVVFIETPRAKLYTDAGASNADVYQTYVMGEEPFGISDISTGAKLIHHTGKDTGDALESYETLGWKVFLAVKEFDALSYINIESSSSMETRAF